MAPIGMGLGGMGLAGMGLAGMEIDSAKSKMAGCSSKLVKTARGGRRAGLLQCAVVEQCNNSATTTPRGPALREVVDVFINDARRRIGDCGFQIWSTFGGLALDVANCMARREGGVAICKNRRFSNALATAEWKYFFTFVRET